MIHTKKLDAFTAKFAQRHTEPLRITVRLQSNSRIVNYDPIHLDGLLARAVVERATDGRLLADSEEGYWIPLPLKVLWQSKDGYPLWAATTLYPVVETIEDTYVRHKRNTEGFLHNKKKMVTRAGPWMERRLPTPVQICDTYEALCIGNRDAVQKLLDGFTHIGKLRLGRIVRIDVEPVNEFSLWRNDALVKPIPAASEQVKWLENPSLIGWTPPFWKPSLFQMGWRVGTRQIDFFRDVPTIKRIENNQHWFSAKDKRCQAVKPTPQSQD